MEATEHAEQDAAWILKAEMNSQSFYSKYK